MPLNAAAAYLQFLRKGQGLTQAMLAATLSLPVLTIERLERAEAAVAPEVLAAVVSALGASSAQVEYLLRFEPQSKEEGAKIIRLGIDLAKAWLRGEQLAT